jgi:hypothetical protein
MESIRMISQREKLALNREFQSDDDARRIRSQHNGSFAPNFAWLKARDCAAKDPVTLKAPVREPRGETLGHCSASHLPINQIRSADAKEPRGG